MRRINLKNIGFINEENLVKALNGKKVNEVNLLLQLMLYDCFKDIKEKDYIKAYLGNGMEKTDVIIKIKNESLNISVKYGIKNSVHCEGIYTFLKFLKEELKIPTKIVNYYLDYHYGDGTLNGTGLNRISLNEYKTDPKNVYKISKVNEYFNNPINNLKIVKRFILKGTDLKNKEVDVLFHGTPQDFFYVKKDDVINYLEKKYDLASSSIHFGRLSVQPANRCLNRNPLYERKRKQVEIKWYNMLDSIFEIMNDNAIKNMKK